MGIIRNNYYVNSFFWSTVSRILSAILSFISVPLLLGYYGKADYGILGIATACNGYMGLLDLGMNTGAVKFFSQWKAEDKQELIQRVANTNQTFYLVIAAINIVGLVILAIWGEPVFSVSHEEFIVLRECLLILALFAFFSWETTPFSQLLIADKQVAYTMKFPIVQTILKFILIIVVIECKLPLTVYFFGFTAIISLLIIPYAIKCKRDGLILSFKPKRYWKDFRVVLSFSLAIFALSLFQMTSTQSRPILLSIFAKDGAGSVADFNIIQVFPQFIIMLSGAFSSIFLPQTAAMVAKNDLKATQDFAYKWTVLTTVVVNVLCFPFIIGAGDALSAYVGSQYSNLSIWLIIWIMTVLLQMHTTPANALVLAYGKTKLIVIGTAVACVVSMLLNIFLCHYFQVGSAIIAYFIYVIIISCLYYFGFYKSLLKLSRLKMLMCFLKPTLMASIALGVCYLIPFEKLYFWDGNRLYYLLMLAIKAIAWFIPYVLLIVGFKVVNIKDLIYANKH